MIPYWNAYSFFVTYARVDNWKPGKGDASSRHTLDRWILSRLEWLRETVETSLNDYDATSAAGAIDTFIDELTNWYIRRSRRRFWKSEDDQDKAAAYATLYKVLCDMNRMLAPFLPFVTETIFQNLERAYEPSVNDSVHLAIWPTGASEARDKQLETEMSEVRGIVTIARSLRNEGNVRVRQPLPEIVVYGISEKFSAELENLILDELNIKRLQYCEDQSELFSYRAKADFQKLGPRLGRNLKEVAVGISNLDDDAIQRLLDVGMIDIAGNSVSKGEIILEQVAKDGYWVRSEGNLTVAVDNRINEHLRREWLAREFVHHVQNLRKEADLEVTQRIKIEFSSENEMCDAITAHLEYIKTETLANSLELVSDLPSGKDFNVGGLSGKITVNSV